MVTSLEIQLGKARNEILETISHEQRASLNGISSYSEAIIEETKKKDIDREFIKKQGNRILVSNSKLLYNLAKFLDHNNIANNNFSLEKEDFAVMKEV